MIERFYSCGHQLAYLLPQKKALALEISSTPIRIGLGHQHGRRFNVSGHQNGGREVM